MDPGFGNLGNHLAPAVRTLRCRSAWRGSPLISFILLFLGRAGEIMLMELYCIATKDSLRVRIFKLRVFVMKDHIYDPIKCVKYHVSTNIL